jgi:serine/threonine protein kinase
LHREFVALRQAGQHPGILRAYESGVAMIAGREYPWYSMEIAEGGTLADRIEARRATVGTGIPWDEPVLRAQVIAEFTAVGNAVAHLHGLGIVHHDVKPSNVLVTAGGGLRLSDFGLAKTVEPCGVSLPEGLDALTGIVVGTPPYIAPEQAQGDEVGKGADVYALGILLAELALGQRPEPVLSGAGGSTLGRYAGLGKLPPSLRRFILRCTDRSSEMRPADARAVQEDFGTLGAAPSNAVQDQE